MGLQVNKMIVRLSIFVFMAMAQMVLGQSIRLRGSATVEAGMLRVGDVATITGLDQATCDKFAQSPIITLDQSATIRAEQVLFAIISENGNSAITSHLQVNGPVECMVDVAGNGQHASNRPLNAGNAMSNRAVTAAVATDIMPAIAAVSEPARIEPAPQKSSPTLEEILISQIVEQLGVAREDVRISIDTISPLLGQAVTGDTRWVVRPMGHCVLGTLDWDTQLVQGTRPLQRLTVQTKVLQRTTVVLAQDTIRPGDVVKASQVKTQEHWLDRKITTLFSAPEDVIGQMALPARGVAAGSMLDQRDFKPVSMATNGDLVTVYLISGGLTIKDQARAVNSGRLHETIQLRSESGGNDKPGAVYQATLIGRDVAVVGALDPATEAKLKELR